MDKNERALRKKKARRIIFDVVIFVFTLIMLLPFVWIIILSFKTNGDILSSPFALPDELYLDNYVRALDTINIFNMYKNTMIIVVAAILIQVVITYLSSFAFTRLKFRKKFVQSGLRNYFLFGLAIPVYVLLFPIYKITLELNLYGTHLSLILVYVAMSVPFNTLLFTGFLKGVPAELEEAAVIDGCGLYRICFQIILPVIKPALITVIVFNALYIWNEFPLATTLISDQSMETLALGISYFKGRYSIDYGSIVSASILIMIPQIIFYGFFQKYIIDGMTAGAVKG